MAYLRARVQNFPSCPECRRGVLALAEALVEQATIQSREAAEIVLGGIDADVSVRQPLSFCVDTSFT